MVSDGVGSVHLPFFLLFFLRSSCFWIASSLLEPAYRQAPAEISDNVAARMGRAFPPLDTRYRLLFL